MKNIKKIFASLIGAVAIITLFVLNLNFALNDYGIVTNKLHTEILAQSGSSGSGSSGGGGGSSCQWRTGHSSLTGWIAICDDLGIGYSCDCGDWKKYPDW